MASPCLGVPLPGGNPAPSGPMLMSQGVISSGEIMRPRFGLSATAVLETTTSAEAAARRRLRVDMLDLPTLSNAPASDRIEMVERLRATIGDALGAALRLHLGTNVPGGALDFALTTSDVGARIRHLLLRLFVGVACEPAC